MKLSEMKPCAKCGGKIAPIIYRVTVERHFVNVQAVNTTLGLTQMFNGNLALAEVMTSQPDATQLVDTNTALFCQDCGIGVWSDVLPPEEDEDGGCVR